MPSEKKPTYVDLFAGCGGLSLGLENAGWDLSLAVEKSPMAAQTFHHNLLDSSLSEKDWHASYCNSGLERQFASGLIVSPVSDVLEDSGIMNNLAGQDIDLVAGGPPCQGFSFAGRRNKEDARNALAWDFLDFAASLQPKFIVMENVLGMNARFSSHQGETVFKELAKALRHLGDETLSRETYVVQQVSANALHFGAAQHRPRLLLVACRVDVASKLGIKTGDEIWHSDFADNFSDEEVPTLAPIPTASAPGANVRDALSDLLGFGDSNYTRFLKDNLTWSKMPAARSIRNHITRAHGERATSKFAVYHLIHEFGLNPLLIKDPSSEKQIAARKVALDNLPSELKFPLESEGPLNNISLSEFRDLLEILKTKKHSQRVLSLHRPSPTVVTAADDMIHPILNRVLTVRELARFQGFPDSFEFKSKETTGGLKRRHEVPQYSQVGNAVSPFLAHAIGSRLRALLEEFMRG